MSVSSKRLNNYSNKRLQKKPPYCVGRACENPAIFTCDFLTGLVVNSDESEERSNFEISAGRIGEIFLFEIDIRRMRHETNWICRYDKREHIDFR